MHPATKNGHPAATVLPVNRLRPPDLIIQDELHLITGALGTAVGLFEVAVETLSSWDTLDGKPVRPVIVASTATVRNALEQVRGLYYIQASSRVGRDASDRPGLVVALGNWARPRDLAHFEQFRHYHETFYAQVEALSVTPFSPTSLARGIDGLLVSAARVAQATQSEGLSPEREAWRIKDQRSAVEALAERLKARIAAAAQGDEPTKRASDLLVNRIDR
jgi:hypothetical protein